MPRFARSLTKRFLFQFYICTLQLHFCSDCNLGWEEDLFVDNILSVFKLVVLVPVDGKPEIVRISHSGTGHIQLAMSEHLHRQLQFIVSVYCDLPGIGAKFQPFSGSVPGTC